MSFQSRPPQFSVNQMAFETYETLKAYGREIKEKGPDDTSPSITLSTGKEFLVQAPSTLPTPIAKISTEFFRNGNWSRQQAVINNDGVVLDKDGDELVNLAIWSITQDTAFFVRCHKPQKIIDTFRRISLQKQHDKLVQRSIDALIEFGERDDLALVVEKTGEGKSYLALKQREEGEPQASREVDLFLLSEEGKAFFREMEGILEQTDASQITRLKAGFMKFENQAAPSILFPDRPGEIDFADILSQPYTPPVHPASPHVDGVSMGDPASQTTDSSDFEVVQMEDMEPIEKVVSPEVRSRLALQAYLANPSAYILRVVKNGDQNVLQVSPLVEGSWSEKRRKSEHPFAELGQISDKLIPILQTQDLWANSSYWAQSRNAKMKDLFMRHILDDHVEKLRSSGALGKLCTALEKKGLLTPGDSYWTALAKIKEEFLSLLSQKEEIEKSYERRVNAVQEIISLAMAIEDRDGTEEQLLQDLIKHAKKDPAFLEKSKFLEEAIDGIFGKGYNKPQAVDDALNLFKDTSSHADMMKNLPLLRLEGLDVLAYLLEEDRIDVAKFKRKEDELVIQQSASRTREALAEFGRPSSEIDEKTSIPKPSFEPEATIVPEKGSRREFIKVSSTSSILRAFWQMIEKLFGYVHSDALETAEFLTSEKGQAQISAMSEDMALRQRVKEHIHLNYKTDGKRDKAGLLDLIERLPQPHAAPWFQHEISISKLSEKDVETRLRTRLGTENFAILESFKPKLQSWTEYLYDLYKQDEIKDYADILVGFERLQVKVRTDLTAELRRLQIRDAIEYITIEGVLTTEGNKKLQTLSGYTTLLQLQETVVRFTMGSVLLVNRLIHTADVQQQRDVYPILRSLCEAGLESMNPSRPSAKTLSMLEEGEGKVIEESRAFLEGALKNMQVREEETKVALEERKLKGYLLNTKPLSFEELKEVIEYIDERLEFLQKILTEARGAELRNLLQNLKSIVEIVEGKEVVEKEATMFSPAKKTTLELKNPHTKSALFLARDLASVASGLSDEELVMYAEYVMNSEEEQIHNLLQQSKMKSIFLNQNLIKLPLEEKRRAVELVARNPEHAQHAIEDIFRKGVSLQQALLVYRNFTMLDAMITENYKIKELRETINTNVAGKILLSSLHDNGTLKIEDFMDMVRVIANSNHRVLYKAFIAGTKIVEEDGRTVFKGDAAIAQQNINLIYDKTKPENTKKIFSPKAASLQPFAQFSGDREKVKNCKRDLLGLLEDEAMRAVVIVDDPELLRRRALEEDPSLEGLY